MRNHVEDDNQEAFIRWCQLNESKYPKLSMLFSIPNGGNRSPREASRLKRQGVRAGVYDLFLSCPKHPNIYGTPSPILHGLYIEMKAGKNKLSEKQKDWKIKAARYNYKCIECWSWIDAVNGICEYLGIPEKN